VVSSANSRGARALGAVPQWELLLLAGVFARDWPISIPDHEGTDGHWGAPREPGYCTLDGIRAALSFDPLRLEAYPGRVVGLFRWWTRHLLGG